MANSYFDALADEGRWRDIATVFGGFMGANVVEALAEGSMDFNAPSEAYGVVGIVGAEAALSGQTKRMVQLGAGLHTADEAAQRFGIKQQIMGLI